MLRQSTSQAGRGRDHLSPYRAFSARVPIGALVSAGIFMFALYIAMDVIASLRYDGYSYKDQTISELSAIDAPTRGMWLAFGVLYAVLAFAFAFGVLSAAGRHKRFRIIGWLLVAFAISNVLWWFAPMHQREVLAADGGDWRDTVHLVLGGVSSVLFFGMIGIGAFAFGRWFRWYSFATIAVMLVFGWLMNLDVQAVADNEPTPWLGIYERLAIEGSMLWMAAFAVVLFLTTREGNARTSPSAPSTQH